MKTELNDLNETKMSLENMPVIIVPKPPPLVRQVCYLPEHYPPFAPHSDEPNCPCSFCAHKRYAESIKEVNLAIKELPQLSAEEFEEEILLEPVSRGFHFPIPVLSRSTNDPSTWEVDDEEEIFLLDMRQVTRGLEDFPIPVLSRSTNDPSTWEADDEEEILLF